MTGSGRAPADPLLRNACWSLHLSLGRTSHLDEIEDWPAALDFTIAERCAALAWVRSGSAIATYADSVTSRRWTDFYHAAYAKGNSQLSFLGAIADEARRTGVHCVVLKGPALSEQLYGDPGVRCSDDIDVFVPTDQRARMRDILSGLGWTYSFGSALAGADETFVKHHGDVQFYLEVHSSISNARLTYLHLGDPEWTTADLYGFPLKVHSGALLPAYLAANLAKHQFAPLMRTVDIATLWGTMDADRRLQSLSAARQCGLARYLRWALRRAECLSSAALGDPEALRALGFSEGRRADLRPIMRDLQLAQTPWHAIKAVGSFVWPPWLRSRYGGSVVGTLRRVRYHIRAGTLGKRLREWRTLLPAHREADARGLTAPQTRIPSVSGEALSQLVGTVAEAGGTMWIVATGTSMVPTIRAGDRVLLTGAGTREPAVGDIVFINLEGQPLLHRVVAVSAEHVTTRGDGCLRDDVPVRRGAVIARAVRAERAGKNVTLGMGIWSGSGMFAPQRREQNSARRAESLQP